MLQAEYSRNLLFKNGTELDRVFNGVIDRTRTTLDIRSVKIIFGRQRRPRHLKRHPRKPRFEVVVEKPAYNLTVFKVHFGRLTAKMYSKGERVLRIEAIAHNAADLYAGKRIDRFPSIIQSLACIAHNFLNRLQCVDVSFLDAETLERWPRCGSVNGYRTAGIDINRPRQRFVMEALMALSLHPRPVTAATVAEKVREIGGKKLPAYTVRNAAYDLRKFRGKGIVEKNNPGRLYTVTHAGLRVMAAYIILRDKVIIPVLSCCGDLRRIRTHQQYSKVDTHMHAIQREMKQIFNQYRLAA